MRAQDIDKVSLKFANLINMPLKGQANLCSLSHVSTVNPQILTQSMVIHVLLCSKLTDRYYRGTAASQHSMHGGREQMGVTFASFSYRPHLMSNTHV